MTDFSEDGAYIKEDWISSEQMSQWEKIAKQMNNEHYQEYRTTQNIWGAG